LVSELVSESWFDSGVLSLMNSVNLIYEPDSIGKNVCWLPFYCAKFRTETFCIF